MHPAQHSGHDTIANSIIIASCANLHFSFCFLDLCHWKIIGSHFLFIIILAGSRTSQLYSDSHCFWKKAKLRIPFGTLSPGLGRTTIQNLPKKMMMTSSCYHFHPRSHRSYHLRPHRHHLRNKKPLLFETKLLDLALPSCRLNAVSSLSNSRNSI